MSTNTTTTYFVTVRDDGTIVVPAELAAGTMVAVTVLPTVSEAEKTRAEHFAAALKLIDEANRSDFKPPKISDEELKALIKEARNSKETLRWASVITAYQAQEINLGKAAELLGMHELELKAQFIELGTGVWRISKSTQHVVSRLWQRTHHVVAK